MHTFFFDYPSQPKKLKKGGGVNCASFTVETTLREESKGGHWRKQKDREEWKMEEMQIQQGEQEKEK